jgi:hypothetical protein
LRSFFKKHHNYFTAFFLLVVGLIWILGPIVVQLVDSSVAIGASFGMLMLMLAVVVDYLDRLESSSAMQLFEDQSSANIKLLEYVREHNIKSVRCIEYDGESVKPVIMELLKGGTSVHLLLQHPEFAISIYQKNRVLHLLKNIEAEFIGISKSLRIDFYKDVASFRGRVFDKALICAGWYTYDRRINPNEPEVWGHNNPVIILTPSEVGYQHMMVMFDTVFNNLLRNSESYINLNKRIKREGFVSD